jgi:hypothetical protein
MVASVSKPYAWGVQRGAFVGKPAPGPFHCVACKTYVKGTESGHCPRCGWVPPTVAIIVEPPRAPTWIVVAVGFTIAVLLFLALS